MSSKQTPEEKAKELYQKFYYESSSAVSTNEQIAIASAIACVDEIIKANPTVYKLVNASGPNANYTAEYMYVNNEAFWTEVKQELQKM